jgi:hypothetical protein
MSYSFHVPFRLLQSRISRGTNPARCLTHDQTKSIAPYFCRESSLSAKSSPPTDEPLPKSFFFQRATCAEYRPLSKDARLISSRGPSRAPHGPAQTPLADARGENVFGPRLGPRRVSGTVTPSVPLHQLPASNIAIPDTTICPMLRAASPSRRDSPAQSLGKSWCFAIPGRAQCYARTQLSHQAALSGPPEHAGTELSLIGPRPIGEIAKGNPYRRDSERAPPILPPQNAPVAPVQPSATDKPITTLCQSTSLRH